MADIKWEYRTIRLAANGQGPLAEWFVIYDDQQDLGNGPIEAHPRSSEYLADMGNDGWELVTSYYERYPNLVFKRVPKPPKNSGGAKKLQEHLEGRLAARELP